MNVEDYRLLVHEDIQLASRANGTRLKDEFLLYATGILINGEEFDDFIECRYDNFNSQGGNIHIDGYAKDETDNSCILFITEYFGSTEVDSVVKEGIDNTFKRVERFIKAATRREFYLEINDDPQASEFARDLFYDKDIITKYKIYFLTDAYNRQREKIVKDSKIGDTPVEKHVWDIVRLYDLVCSSTQRESVEIKLSDFGYRGIPCVKAVDYRDVVADIEVTPVFEGDSHSIEEKPENIVTYSSYLAVVPGQVLNDLYLEYGSKLLEGNVRSFLSVRGKVNKSIQNTIKNYPEMFFAYNNGLAATATELDTEMTPDGPVITRIKDLQIVNGGQTTASIANTVLSKKRNETVDLSNLYVPMKISVLEHAMAERIIPKISEYSNSQNKVDASDFFSNHPFHIRMEGYSRKIAIPSSGGNQLRQYWFYERNRGQYNQGKMKFKARSAQLKQYSDRYPEKMVVTMLDLARYMELYECAPDIVSRGKQKTLQVFAEHIKSVWQKSDTQFNEFYYKRVISIGIIYRKTDELIKRSHWYRDKKSYKANVIAYTLSLIFNEIKTHHKDYEMDFIRIWNAQDLYEELEDQIMILTQEVYNFITGPRDTENVTEWCKKEACWRRAKSQIWTFNDLFFDTLVNKKEVKQEEKEAKATRKLANEVDALKEIFARGSEYWKKVLEWGISRKLLSDKEISILQMIVNMNYTGRIPTDKQAKVVIQARERLIENHMPLQF